jgi:hypothetical protein
MTRKYFEQIAECLNERYLKVKINVAANLDPIEVLCTIKNVCYDLAYCFGKTYERFDKDKFLNACFDESNGGDKNGDNY